MTYVLVFYATRQGQTLHIAEHIAAAVRARGGQADVVSARQLPEGFSLDVYSAVIVAASVHAGEHEPEMIQFVRENRQQLERMRTVFLSVSLSEAGAEDQTASSERRTQFASDVERMIKHFLTETGWHPSKIQAVAGALMFTHYNRLLRFVMKMIGRREAGITDTSHDYEFTDWVALDRLVDELTAPIPAE